MTEQKNIGDLFLQRVPAEMYESPIFISLLAVQALLTVYFLVYTGGTGNPAFTSWNSEYRIFSGFIFLHRTS